MSLSARSLSLLAVSDRIEGLFGTECMHRERLGYRSPATWKEASVA